jgi:hypothetical protein
MAEKRLGIVMHGVTGRMGMNQHLARSVRSPIWGKPSVLPTPPGC